MSPPDMAEAKARARAAALARRDAAPRDHPAPAALLTSLLLDVIADRRGGPVAGYVAMRGEIDPLPALLAAAATDTVALPVMAEGRGHPLRFRAWTPGAPLVPGGFGTLIPAEGPWVVPEILVVPLVAFDRRGNRLGYGGGFYDRTLAALRPRRPVAIGFAWAAQEARDLPTEPTDQPLGLLVTESEVIHPTPLARPRRAP